MPARYDEARVEAAITALTEGERLREAETVVAEAAPQLQRVLAQALESGGWFADSHNSEVSRVAAVEDQRERETAVRTLLAEETRIGMMVGVAVGWALREELDENEQDEQED